MKLKKETYQKRTSKNFGGLSNPSKMPQKAYSIPAKFCKVGAKLVKIIGSVCAGFLLGFGCYALRGRYRFKNVEEALQRRYDLLILALENPSIGDKWVEEMSDHINRYSKNYFRWFESGDLVNLENLKLIIRVCENTPDTKHWLATREYRTIWDFQREIIEGDGSLQLPDNLVLRVSAPMIDAKPFQKGHTFNTSTVHANKPHCGHRCPITNGTQSCVSIGCVASVGGKEYKLACFNREVANVSYQLH